MFAAENESFYISYRRFANAETRAPVIEYRKGQISERPKQIELEHFEKRMGDLRKIILCRKRPFHTPGEQIARRHEETGHGAVDKIQIHRIERSGSKRFHGVVCIATTIYAPRNLQMSIVRLLLFCGFIFFISLSSLPVIDINNILFAEDPPELLEHWRVDIRAVRIWLTDIFSVSQ